MQFALVLVLVYAFGQMMGQMTTEEDLGSSVNSTSAERNVTVTEVVEVRKVDVLEVTTTNETTTDIQTSPTTPVTNENEEEDAAGCNEKLLTSLELRCEFVYNEKLQDAQDIVDEDERKETFCCAMDNLEKCHLGAYDKANCDSSKSKALRETLAAARLFLAVLSNITCSEFRGKCPVVPNSGVLFAVDPFTSFVCFSMFIVLRLLQKF